MNYCQKRRSELKQANPGLKNTEISKLLGIEWKQCPESVRQPFVEKELREREEYHRKVGLWRQSRKSDEVSNRHFGSTNSVRDERTETVAAKLSSAPPMNPMDLTPVQLSPRELLPIAPKEPEKVSPPLSLKNELCGIEPRDALEVPRWKTCYDTQYDGTEESLIPTILPSTEAPLSPTRLLSQNVARDLLDLGGVAAAKGSQDSISFPLPSDGQNDQHNLVFPSIFYGDTAFDPPIS